MSVVKVIEIIGSSDKGWEEAARNALATATKTVRNVSGMEIISKTADVEDGKITKYKTVVKIAFKYEGE